MIVQTKTGRLEGLTENGVTKFLGIPYAEAPVGDNRFKKTVSKKPWEGCIKADTYAPKCPQLAIPVAPDNGLPQSEDCLYLNVWTAMNEKQNKPVLFWIYGGALSAGEGSSDIYEGSQFVKNGDVIVVTFNYRVGIFGGFFNLGSYPGMDRYTPNAGLYDVLEALKWVKENIEYFGGDKNNITICGESAGASIAALLLCWPEAHGLYQKAILESTFEYAILPKEDHVISDRIISAANIENYSEFLELSTQEILDALSDSCGGNILASGAGIQQDMNFHGSVSAMLKERCADVPLIIGFNHDEGFIFVDPKEEDFLQKVNMMTGILFESVIEAVIQADRTKDLFLYRFDYVPAPLKSKGIGALHSSEMPCVFHNLSCSTAAAMQGDMENAKTVSEAMHGSWIRFMTTGDAGWEAYSENKQEHMIFDVVSKPENGSWKV